jgi:zinc transport system substrate-binding protein
MKSIFSLTLAVMLLAALAPDIKAEDNAKPQRLQITTTIFPPFDFARVIAGGKADVVMLLRPGTESHSFEPTPQDIIRIKNSDIFIYGGGESDEWVRRVLQAAASEKMRTIALLDCVSAVEEEYVEGMQEEQEEGHEGHAASHEEESEGHDVEYDEHVWTSPLNVKQIVQVIADAMGQMDKNNAPLYKSNAEAYIKELDGLDAAFREAVNGGVRKTIVVGDRFPFRYLTDAYGLSYFAAFPGCSTETEPSAATVAFLIDKVKSERIPVVFHIELANEKIADAICEATGARKLLLHSCHNLSQSDFSKGAGYLELMRNNVTALKEALH